MLITETRSLDKVAPNTKVKSYPRRSLSSQSEELIGQVFNAFHRAQKSQGGHISQM